MPDRSNDGSFRMSGRYGEARRDGIVLMEVLACEWQLEIGVEDVPIPGTNESGSKDSGYERSGTLTIQKVHSTWERELWAATAAVTLPERRRLRDQGQRLDRRFTLQTSLDDPEALAGEVWQIVGVRITRLPGGFNGAESLVNRELPFRYDSERPIETFEIIRGQVDPATGLPAIRHIDGRPV